MNPKLMVNPVRPYAWGSRHFIAALQQRPVPAAEPEAELWLGAHPAAPSSIVVDAPADRRETPSPSAVDLRALDRCIAESPVDTLGVDVAGRFGGELPFLMKILAAAQPLSLQAHPDRAQAFQGFEAETAAGTPLEAPERSYKDRRHKPELLVALTPFAALCGFRPVAATGRLLAELGVEALLPYQRLLEAEPPAVALEAVFRALLGLPRSEQQALTDAVCRAASRAPSGPFDGELAWVRRLADLYPGDVGVTGALFLNLVQLAPDEAIFLPAGNLHAYLEGAGVEIMASSDNVLRGGLTPKPINVPELLRILKFDEAEALPLVPTPARDGEWVYPTPAEEFELSRIELEGAGGRRERVPRGPEVLLVSAGRVALGWGSGTLDLGPGSSAFVPASSPPYALSGDGTVFRARVPEDRADEGAAA
jgi:mannose-6-phosphate isomerase